MPPPPLDSTHGWMTSGAKCNHRLWEAHTVERRRAWHAIIALGRQTWSNDVGRGMTSLPWYNTNGRQRWAWHDITALGQHTPSNDVGRGMTSPPLGSTHGRTTSGMACHHRLSEAHTVERRQAWHAIIALGRKTWSNDVRRGMRSLPLDCMHGRTKSGVT